MNNLDGKNALIIGGSSGIGRATAEILAQRGATVHVVGTNPQKLGTVDTESPIVKKQKILKTRQIAGFSKISHPLNIDYYIYLRLDFVRLF